MEQQKSNTGSWKRQISKRTTRLAWWTAGWVVTVAIASFGPEFLWKGNQVLTILSIVLNLALGTGMIIANIRYLKVLDEMMQQVQLQAMGIALGVGVVGGLGYSLLDTTNLIASDAEIAGQVVMMAITYLIAIYTGMRRYQ